MTPREELETLAARVHRIWFPDWKRKKDYARWKAGLPTIWEETLAARASALTGYGEKG